MKSTMLARTTLCAALLVAVAVFIVGQLHIQPSTDESIIGLQSRHILRPPADPDILSSMHPKPVFYRFPVLFMAQPYLFPLEAYLAAVPAQFVPAGPLGARAVPFAMGVLTLWISFLILKRSGSWKEVWPGGLLLVFPSAYVAMLQYGYALPSYPSYLLFLALGVYLMMRYAETPTLWLAICAGVVSAAALAGQLMALPLALMCGVLVFWGGKDVRPRIVNTVVFGGIAATGYAPYALAKYLNPGAYDVVSGRLNWKVALGRVWEPALDHVLPVVSGVKSTVWPDNTRYVELVPGLATLWPFIWLLLLLAVSLLWICQFWKNRFNLQRDSSQLYIMFLGIPVAAVLLFALSLRSHSHTYRYLLGAVWATPFLVAYIHLRAPWNGLRRAVAGFAVLLALLNAATLGVVMNEWATSDFGAEEASLYDVYPAIEFMDREGLTAAYASYHLAYRLTYLSGERITAAQYYNERFPGWPLPYKEYVDQAERPAFVLAPRFAITAEHFIRDMEKMGLEYSEYQAGDLTVFYDFAWPEDGPQGDWVHPAGLRASASHRPDLAYALINGNYTYRWRSRQAQEAGMWLTLKWDEPFELERVYMYYNRYHHDRATALDVEVLDENGSWAAALENLPAGLDAHEFERNRPLYGNEFQRIELPAATETTGVRIRIAEPNAGRDWTVGEVRLWGLSASGTVQD